MSSTAGYFQYLVIYTCRWFLTRVWTSGSLNFQYSHVLSGSNHAQRSVINCGIFHPDNYKYKLLKHCPDSEFSISFQQGSFAFYNASYMYMYTWSVFWVTHFLTHYPIRGCGKSRSDLPEGCRYMYMRYLSI